MDEISPIIKKGIPSIEPITPVEPLMPKGEDVKLFEEAMKKASMPQGGFDGNAGLGFDPTLRGKVEMNTSSQHSAALGDSILKGIQATSDQYQSTMANVRMNIQAMSTNPSSLTPSTMLGLQVNLMQLSTHIDVASKIAGKLTQGVQTLFKNQ